MKAPRYVPSSYLVTGWLHWPLLPINVANEIRAIFPIWLLALALQFWGFVGPAASLAAFGIACCVIPAMAFGHDFTNRTISSSLTLPVTRAEFWSLRMRISALALIPLAIIAIGHFASAYMQTGLTALPFTFLIEIAVGLCIAPWFTLALRSPLAGTVFSACSPFAIWYLAGFVARARPDADEMYQLSLTLFVLTLLCIVGALAGRRCFLGLEVMEGRGISIRRAAVSTSRAKTLPPRRRWGWWQIFTKELRLQKMAFVPAIALTLTVWSMNPTQDIDLAQALLWAWLTGVVVGAAGSSEEKQLGIAEWQALAPMARWKQWSIKVVTQMGLAVTLIMIVPGGILFWGPAKLAPEIRALEFSFCGIAAIVLLSLYVSSLCRTTVRATLGALVACSALLAPALILFFARIQIDTPTEKRFMDSVPGPTLQYFDLFGGYGMIFGLAAFLLACAPMIFHAMENHFTAERGAARIGRQILSILGAALAFFFLAAAGSLSFGSYWKENLRF